MSGPETCSAHLGSGCGRKFVLLHAIKKKRTKVSQNDMRLAIDRMSDCKARS